MKIGAILAAIMLLFGTVAIVTVDNAEAARMGGGRSFGSKPFMNRSAQPPAASRQQNRQQNAQPGAAAQRPGMFGGMGGIFGGLLAGTLLGSLLSGNGLGGGGGFLDIILLGILVFVAYKLFMRFRQKQQEQPAAAGAGFGQRDFPGQQPMQREGFFNQGNSAGVQSGNSGWGALAGQQTAEAAPTVNVPADFNVDEFLRGAKAAYNRMQRSWAKRDLADIAQFATPAVMQELEKQAKDDPNPSNTEIMLVNAQLEGFEQDGNEERAAVYFDVLMRESPAQQQPENAREIWHFVRDGKNGEWKLDGIQQIQ